MGTSTQPKTIKMPKVNDAKVSGQGMDRKVSRKKSIFKNSGVLSAGGGVILFAVLIVPDLLNGGNSLNVDKDKLSFGNARFSTFQEVIPVRATVLPSRSVFLDAIEGGRVERVYTEDGAVLKEGDLIVELSNSNLQLTVTRNEAIVAEQLNNMRTIELSLRQNMLRHKSNLVDINYHIKRLTKRLAREKELLKVNGISHEDMEETEDELDWYKNRLEVTLESQKEDKVMLETQLVFLRETNKRLEKNLEISRANLEEMKVRAPLAGLLSGFDIEVGQSIDAGGRFGQIDSKDSFKLKALVDEFYLGRINVGQDASFTRGGKDYSLSVTKVYPQVNDGQFEVDLKFNENQPSDIRRGQAMQVKFTLGEASPAMLIPNGAHFKDTGGHWIFVVSKDQDEAIRKSIRVGRRNTHHIEVLNGLEEGDVVVISSYADFQNLERLNISD